MKKILLLLLMSFFTLSAAHAEPPKKFKSKKYKQYHTRVYKKKMRVTRAPYSPISAYAVYDYANNQFNNEHNINDVRSIASITKLFTAITVVNSKVDLDEKLLVTGYNSGKVVRGSRISRIDLLKAMVTNSDNLAAEVLANNHPGGFKQFIIDVNDYNKRIGLKNTEIVDSSGLLPGNVSTACDLVQFLNSIKDNTVIKEISNLRGHEIAVPRPKSKKIITIKFHNTNPDIYKMDNVIISKTGFTNPAGRCVVMLVERGQKLYALVVLGARTPSDRSKILHDLIDKSNTVHI